MYNRQILEEDPGQLLTVLLSPARNPVGYHYPIIQTYKDQNFVKCWFLWKGTLPVVCSIPLL